LGDKLPNIHLIFLFIMSTKLLAFAVQLADTNPAGAQLITSLAKANSGAEIVEALNVYDSVVPAFDYVVSPNLEAALGVA
jgi:hypothetical protein